MSLPLARRRPPELFTLFSKDVRIDVLVGAPRVAAVGRYVRAPFEPERERTRLDEGHFVHYFPARVRISFIAQPELVLDMQPREIRVEHTRELDSPPPERVRDVATEVVEAFADKHPNKHRAYVDYDPASHGVDVSWEAPAPRHMLTPARTTRGPGQMPPRPVRFRIHLLLREAANEAGLRAASAQDKANALAREWQLSSAQIRAIEEEFRGTGTVHRGEATRSLLTAEPEDAPGQLGGGASTSRLGPKRDPRRWMTRSVSRDPPSLEVMAALWRDVNQPDPRYSRAEFRGGAVVYMNEGAIEDAFVLADALEEVGYPKLALDLNRWLRQLQHYNEVERTREPVHVHYPTSATWRSLQRRVELALRELRVGRATDIVWLADRKEAYDRRRGRSIIRSTFWPVRVAGEGHEQGSLRVEFLTGARRGQSLVVGRSDVRERPVRVVGMESEARLAPGSAHLVRRDARARL